MTHHLLPILLLFSLSALAQPKLELELVQDGLSQPVDITHAGDSRLFIVERSGRIRILDETGSLLTTPFLDIDDRVSPANGERGLLGLTFHPDYAENGYFYVNYTNNSGDTRISRFSVSDGDPNLADAGSEHLILEINQPYDNHNAGDLYFGPDGYLYIGMGDGGSGGDPQNFSQNRQSLLGKMLRIDVDNGDPYSIPPDNPFAEDDFTLDEIWAIGLRNPWRFSFDRETGDMWIGDVGQSNSEEINFQPAESEGGENYGWRCYEGFSAFNTNDCGPASEYTDPVQVYNTGSNDGCSVTGGNVYRGQELPGLYGKYVYADFCSGKFWLLEPNADGSWRNTEVLDGAGGQFVAFGEDAAGELYVAALNFGRVYRVRTMCTKSPDQPRVEGNNAICEGGEDAVLTAPMPIPEGYTYFWYRDGELIAETSSMELSVSEAGSYQVRYRANELGECDSPFSDAWEVQLVEEPASLVTVEDGILQATEGYDSYQWYLEGELIEGATSSTFTPEEGGAYSVEVTDEETGCSWRSVELVITRSAEELGLRSVRVAPVPFEEELRLMLDGMEGGRYQIQVLDAAGKVRWSLQNQLVSGAWSTEVPTADWPAGLYLLLIENQGKWYTQKIVK